MAASKAVVEGAFDLVDIGVVMDLLGVTSLAMRADERFVGVSCCWAFVVAAVSSMSSSTLVFLLDDPLAS